MYFPEYLLFLGSCCETIPNCNWHFDGLLTYLNIADICYGTVFNPKHNGYFCILTSIPFDGLGEPLIVGSFYLNYIKYLSHEENGATLYLFFCNLIQVRRPILKKRRISI